MPYYKANKATSKLIDAEFDKRIAAEKEAYKLSKSLGASSKNLLTLESCGVWQVAGFVFDDTPPDPKLWKQNKLHSTCYFPRAVRANAELLQKINDLKTDYFSAIKKALGLSINLEVIQGELRDWNPGICIVDGYAFISTPSETKKVPKNCRRISDTAWEKAVASTKKKTKRAK